MTAAQYFANRALFHCDNLPAFLVMNMSCVDLTATDPPFNNGRDFQASSGSIAAGAECQDRWSCEDDVGDALIDHLQDG